jgi:RNA polymerase sigma-70 factor (ECF subfamily)
MREDDQDAQDCARILAGDVDAFEGIVLRWQRRLIDLAWRFCRDRAMAEDMAQEVLLKVFRSLGTFRGDAKFSTWITAIALNTYRSRIRTEGPPLLSLDPLRAFGIAAEAGDAVEQSEQAEAVRRAVLSLPERYREALVMYYFEEKDLSESARVLKVAEGTLKARLHRGRELLRQRLANVGAVTSEVSWKGEA